MIPEAIVRSMRHSFAAWVAKASLAGVLLGSAYGVSQAGCKNDAITYAKTLWPDAKCSAVRTCMFSCDHDNDTAICRIKDRIYQCNVIYDNQYGRGSTGCQRIYTGDEPITPYRNVTFWDGTPDYYIDERGVFNVTGNSPL